jgi:hypothetical protein
MMQHLPVMVSIADFNELTKSEVTELTSSTVDEIASAFLRRQIGR